MPTVELIYDRDCPHTPQAREHLLRAFREAGLASFRWRECERAAPDAPAYARACGSPTILVDGRDVASAAPADAACCRIYTDEQGRKQGAPPVALIAAALAGNPGAGKPWRGTASLLPAVGAAFLPKLVCPACWPAYTGLLGAMGLGFVNYTPFLLPLTAVFLALVLATLARRAGTRRGYGPLILGLLASAVVLIGKFRFDSDAATWVGIALLVGASLWNAWPLRHRTAACPACADGTNRIPIDSPEGGDA